MSANPSDEKELEANKRAALAGQWRTPPLPAFAAAAYGQSQQQQQQPAPAPAPQSDGDLGLPNPSSIPSSSEDYAKALQAAYRKGAEAAARMAQQQQIPSAASCPNFQQTSPKLQPQSQPISQTIPEEAAYTAQVDPRGPVPDPLISMPPPAPPTASASTASQHIPPSSAAATASNTSRSVSLPDMSAYAAQAEEEKRQKRLARNRASARLRRLRKKNLVSKPPLFFCLTFVRVSYVGHVI